MAQTEEVVKQPERETGHAPRESGSKHGVLITVIVLAIVAAVVIGGIVPRLRAKEALQKETYDLAVPTVNVAHAKQGAPQTEIVLPGNMQAFTESPIYARTNGYLKKWYVDIGGRVKAGQLLAEIETPENDQELHQAQAAQVQAEANLDLAKTTADRWQNLLKSDGVSQQEVDQNVSAFHAREADLQAAKANVQRLKDLQSFQRVTAPFDGIVTARNVDVGALIANGNAVQLFRMAQTDVLRIYVQVPQTYSRSIQPGVEAKLTIPEFPHGEFPEKVIRSAGAIDPASRTLLTEVQIPNPKGDILPGAYATVHFKVTLVEPPLAIPPNALLFRSQGPQVAVVTPQGTIHLQAVTMGRDLGTSLEVLDGVKANDNVVVNPPDSIAEGAEVTVTQTAPSVPPPPAPAANPK